ncbi:MAG: serine/threonine-protein kinase [Myxococcales bacterium]|nr:serine/threonine-protein kinase [Myxococcales bacterium]
MESVDRFGKYELLERLGQGGMAEVFLAVAPGLAGFSKKLVLKRVLPNLESDPNQIEMFLDEARLAARLEHPNICQVFDLGEHEGTYFIVMEHVPGVPFNKVIEFFRKQNQLVPAEVSLRAVAQLLEALEYAHSLKDERGRPLNLVHRDVTPTNIMVTPLGSVKLLDFGIARASTRQHQTQAGMTKGKLGYMSPEQCRADPLDNRSDLFAVGAILYALATGRTPYVTRNMSTETFEDMVYARFPRPTEVQPSVSPELERIILKAMAANPSDRYARAFDMLRDVEAFAQGLSMSLGPNQLSEVVQAIAGSTSAAALLVEDADPSTRPTTGSRAKLRPPPPPGDVTGALQRQVETRALPAELDAAGANTKDLRPPPPSARPTERLSPVSPPVPLPDIDTVPSDKGLAATARTLRPGPARSRLPMALAIGLAIIAVGVVSAAGLSLTSRKQPPTPIEEEEVEGQIPTVLAERMLVVEPPTPDPVPAPEVVPPTGKAQPTVPTPPPTEPPRAVQPTVKKVVAPVRPAVAVPLAPGARTGRLMVTSTPRAQVSFEKRVLGQTPLEVSLPEGTQRVELIYPGQPPRRMFVNIVAGQTTKLTDTLN